MGFGRDTDEIIEDFLMSFSNVSTGGVTISMGSKQENTPNKYAESFSHEFVSETKHKTCQGFETELKTSKTKPVFLPPFQFS